MKFSPLVSVILPVYNRSAVLERSVQSVINQTYKNWELIIVDDDSKDETGDVVKVLERKDWRIRNIRLKANSGPSSARNEGIKVSKGELITFLDSDDEYYSEKIEEQVKLFNFLGPGYKVLSCGRIDYNGSMEVRQSLPKEKKSYYQSLLRKEKGIGAGTPFLMIKKEVFHKDRIFFDENLKAMEDWDLLIRICKKYEMSFVPKHLVRDNHHKMDRSYNSENVVNAWKYQYAKYLKWLKEDPEAHYCFVKQAALILQHYRGLPEGLKFLKNSIGNFTYNKYRLRLINFWILMWFFTLPVFRLFYLKFFINK